MCAFWCCLRCLSIRKSAVTAALAADGLDADLTVLGDVLTDLREIPTIHMAIHRHALAALAAEQLVQGHVGHFAFDVPQGHVHTGDRIVLDGAIAPVAVLVHELPDVVDVRNITADQQRAQIFFHNHLDGQVPVSEGTAAQAVQARLAGFHLHHQKVDAFRRGADGFDVSDGYHESLLIGSGWCRRSRRIRTGRTRPHSR